MISVHSNYEMKRRELLTGTAAVGIVGLSGCLSGILGTVTSLESTPAGVSQSALASTGYEAVGIEEIVTEETVEIAGQSETIAVTSYLSQYEKQVGIEGIAETATATFAVLSTPQLDVAGQTLNPVGEMSSRELVELIADSYDNLSGIEADGEQMVTILDQSVTQTRFVAEARFAGLPLDLDIHVTEAVERGEDLLVTVGVYPRQFRSIEASNTRELSESVIAEADTASEAGDSESTENPAENETADSENESTGNDSDGINITGRLQ